MKDLAAFRAWLRRRGDKPVAQGDYDETSCPLCVWLKVTRQAPSPVVLPAYRPGYVSYYYPSANRTRRSVLPEWAAEFARRCDGRRERRCDGQREPGVLLTGRALLPLLEGL